jgi:hypothetical protein
MLGATEEVTPEPSTADRRVAPIALQRWESDGGALPALAGERNMAIGKEN